ncbi:MAG: GGDEF domain-containing response regulator [Dehalococcoidia bacterium]|nr:MAG: GGDEF domain-containing response regulator [Dehalococcoidia bacterium]
MFVDRRKNEFNILVVEDNEVVFNELKNGLADTDYKLWRVSTGAEALKLVKDGYFIAIISELLLSDIDGIELIRRFKKISKQINIIVLTTYAVSNDLAVEAMKVGAFLYLQKPLNMEEVKLVLRRAIENSVLLIQAGRKDYYQDISSMDGLTGVYNHRYFHEMLDWTISHLRRFPQTFSLFMIDVDHFKQYNDTKGHVEGDVALCSLARLFEEYIRDIDMVFRYGGEEFAIILAQTQVKEAERIGQRLVESVKKKLPVTISIGLASFPTHTQTKKDLIIKADRALYRAKRLGRDRICVFDEKADS